MGGFSRYIKGLAHNSKINWVVYWWAFFEATVWFLFPEFLISLLALAKPKKWLKLVGVTVMGTFTGGLVGSVFSLYFPEISLNILDRVPLITGKMITQVHWWLQSEGSRGVVHQLTSLIPYKTFILSSGVEDLNLLWFLLLGVGVRSIRFTVVVGLAAVIGRYFERASELAKSSVYLLLIVFNFIMIWMNTSRYS